MNYYLGQTVENIRSCFENSPNKIKFFNPEGVELSESQTLGTNYIIKLYSDYAFSEVIDEVYVVLVGDTNGDSFIDAFDIDLILRHIKLITPLTTTTQLIAANPIKTSSVDAESLNIILRHIKLLESLYK